MPTVRYEELYITMDSNGLLTCHDRQWSPVSSPLNAHQRLAVTTVLSTLREASFVRWAAKRSRPLFFLRNDPETLARADAFQSRVLCRIGEVNTVSGTGTGVLEAILWDWEPGQASGLSVVDLIDRRSFYPFQLRGHTLYSRDRITNVTVDFQREMDVQKAEPRIYTEIRGDLFPDYTEEF